MPNRLYLLPGAAALPWTNNADQLAWSGPNQYQHNHQPTTTPTINRMNAISCAYTVIGISIYGITQTNEFMMNHQLK
jgi:hypothetical protein